MKIKDIRARSLEYAKGHLAPPITKQPVVNKVVEFLRREGAIDLGQHPYNPPRWLIATAILKRKNPSITGIAHPAKNEAKEIIHAFARELGLIGTAQQSRMPVIARVKESISLRRKPSVDSACGQLHWNGSPEKQGEFYWSDEWRTVRFTALRRNRGACELCGNGPSPGKPLHVDHIKPRSKYPKLALDPDNLQVLCIDCNLGKSNADETDWRKKRAVKTTSSTHPIPIGVGAAERQPDEREPKSGTGAIR